MSREDLPNRLEAAGFDPLRAADIAKAFGRLEALVGTEIALPNGGKAELWVVNSVDLSAPTVMLSGYGRTRTLDAVGVANALGLRDVDQG